MSESFVVHCWAWMTGEALSLAVLGERAYLNWGTGEQGNKDIIT